MKPSHSIFDFDDAFRKIVYAEQPDPPPEFFHYTTADGLRGIVESKAFWATHYKYTNDSEEVRYGITLAIEECRNAMAEQTADENKYPISDYLNGNVPNSKPSDALLQIAVETLETDQFETRSQYEFFFACFSGEQNILSQWRAYASDANGYSIGFHTEDLKNEWINSLLSNGDPLDLLQV